MSYSSRYSLTPWRPFPRETRQQELEKSRDRYEDLYRQPQIATRCTISCDEYYLRKMQDILSTSNGAGYAASATQLSDHLFIGSYRDAESYAFLRRIGITHVLNCAAWRRVHTNPYPPSSGVREYQQFEADDDENYNILQHFFRAKTFIDRAKHCQGKCLVHCAMGINRSGAICTAYLMIDKKIKLLDACRKIKEKRGTVLTNRGFRKQLIKFARQRSLL